MIRKILEISKHLVLFLRRYVVFSRSKVRDKNAGLDICKDIPSPQTPSVYRRAFNNYQNACYSAFCLNLKV